jgi:hypothetical protein
MKRKKNTLFWSYDDPHDSHGNPNSFSDNYWNGGLVGKEVGWPLW